MQHALKRVLLAGALLGAVAVAVFGNGQDLSADPVGESRSGKMTWYDDAGKGACGTDVNPVREDLVAVSHALFTSANPNNDDLCKGVSIEVTYNGRTLTLPVRDKCMKCSPEHIDLSKAAFQKLEPDLGLGVVPVAWRFVNGGGGGSGGGGGWSTGDGNGGDTQAPSAPANLRSTGRTPTTVSLAWDASNDDVGVTGYDIYDGSTKVTTVTDAGAELVGLPANSTHSYTVKARDAAGNVSDASNSVTLTTFVTSGDGSDGSDGSDGRDGSDGNGNGDGDGDNGTCPSAWNSTASYVPGDVVSFGGHKFEATHYSTGAEPNSPASWAAWDDAGTCG